MALIVEIEPGLGFFNVMFWVCPTACNNRPIYIYISDVVVRHVVFGLLRPNPFPVELKIESRRLLFCTFVQAHGLVETSGLSALAFTILLSGGLIEEPSPCWRRLG